MKIIPAFILVENGATPRLQVAEDATGLSDSITQMGLEVEQGGLNLPERKSNPHAPSGELETTSADAETGEQPRNGYRSCMADMLARPEGAKKLNQKESQGRFKEAARECSERRAKEAIED